MEYIVKTFHGLEPVLVEELKQLGAAGIKVLKRAVSFDGDLAMMYRANLELRTALRILQPIASFKARDERELYRQIFRMDWSEWLNNRTTFAIDSVVFSEYFSHTKYVALKTKDAIVDQFRQRTGARPSIDTQEPDVRINIHVTDDRFTVSMDASGSSLHQRGYRDPHHPAPLNEALAAGMLKLSGWTPDRTLHDPMCGTGTFLVEAAMMTRNIPPRLNRSYYAFRSWQNYDRDLWNDIYLDASRKVTRDPYLLSGGDIDRQAVINTRETLEELTSNCPIPIDMQSFDRYKPTTDEGMLIMNPPYGERLRPDDIIGLYSEIGDHLKQSFSGWEAWIISSNVPALKRVGLRPSRKMTLYNGSLECRFHQFTMYAGTKKHRATQDEPEK